MGGEPRGGGRTCRSLGFGKMLREGTPDENVGNTLGLLDVLESCIRYHKVHA